MLKGNKTIPFRFPRVLIRNHDSLVKLPVYGKHLTELLRSGLPAEATHEELSLSRLEDSIGVIGAENAERRRSTGGDAGSQNIVRGGIRGAILIGLAFLHAVLGGVGVVGLGGEAFVVDDETEGVLHQASFAAHVFAGDVAVHELLLRQRHQLAGVTAPFFLQSKTVPTAVTFSYLKCFPLEEVDVALVSTLL
nr:hypothetical protein Iba_chr14cCG0250 [Ipomoea batatas]